MAFVVGIDTTGYCNKSCLVLGSPTRIDELYKNFDKILKDAGHHGDMHWRRVRKKKRKRMLKPLAEAIKNSGLTFFVFDHSRPRDRKKKEFFLRALPNKYASELENYLASKEGFVFIKCDTDFNKILKNGTKQFLFRLLKNLGTRILGVEVSPHCKKDYILRLSLLGGRSLQLIGQEADKHMKEICVADIVLGLSKEPTRLDRVIRKRLL